MKIEKLTETEKARFPEFIDKWTNIGLCTEPANRKLAEEGIIEAYAIAGLAAPKIVWCGSPLSQGLTRAILLDKKFDIGKKVRASVWESVWESVWASVGASVRASVWASVWESVGASVGESVRESVGASVRASVYGQHDANWLAFYDFFKEVSGLKSETKKLNGLWKISQNAGWFLPHENICWISERHTKIIKDDRGRLHSEESAAVEYPDGWAIYAWHGVRVPAWIIINPETITAAAIDKESNQEIKRVMIERFGLHNYVKSGIKIHQDDFGTLYQKDIAGSDLKLTMVHVVNGTKEPDGTYKDYFLEVHPELRPMHDPNGLGEPQKMTARNAVASTYGMRGEEYLVTVRT